MKDKIKWLLLIMMGFASLSYAQLVEKERIPIEEGKVIIGGDRIIDISKGDTDQANARVSGANSIQLANGEKPKLLTKDYLYTTVVDPENYNAGQKIIKYAVKANSLTKIKEMDYPSYNTNVSFFNSGEMVGELFEEGEIQFYTKDIRLVKTYKPVQYGYEYSFKSIYNNEIFFAIPMVAANSYKLILATQDGEILFDKEFNDTYKLQSVSSTSDYLSALLYNYESNQFVIQVYNKSGDKISRLDVERGIQNTWQIINNVKSPLLVTASIEKGVSFYSILTQELINARSWQEIFSDANVDLLDHENRVDVIGLNVFNGNKVLVFIGQPAGKNGYDKNLLCTIDLASNFKYSFNKTSHSDRRPSISCNGNDVYIVNYDSIERFTDYE